MQYTVVAVEAQRHDCPSLDVRFLHTGLGRPHVSLMLKVQFGEKSDVPNFPLTPNVVVKPSQI